MWIHQHQSWPNFTWDSEALASRLVDIHRSQSRLLGRMEALGFDLRREASLSALMDDVVKSSAIEGENLNPEEVRSSVARKLKIEMAGLIPVSRDVEGVVEMVLDATQRFSEPLTKRRLFDWHASLFPTGRSGMRKITVGNWRTKNADPMQVISGASGKERIHFEAPKANRLDGEMQVFLAWFNERSDLQLNGQKELDPILKAGIAHLWFVTVHPFEDGNGRIARAVGDMALARADGTQDRFYSLSSQIKTEHKEYYNQLESQQRATPDITAWLGWFLDCLGRAIFNSEDILGRVLFKSRLWAFINQDPVNKRQQQIINRMLEYEFEGHMNTSKYAKLAKCSKDTALRDIQELVARGVFIQNPSGGRSTSYRLTPDSELPTP